MRLELPKKSLDQMIARQLGNLFVWIDSESQTLQKLSSYALEKCEYCFARVANKYYNQDGIPSFDPFHSGQYTFFLYQLSHLAWREAENINLAARLYYLNKALNGLDLFYEVEMPDIWTCDHPVGAVLGRAKYRNYFNFRQGCYVGNSLGEYPKFGERVTLLAGSKIFGSCLIGEGVLVAANSLIIDREVPSNSLVYGQHPDVKDKPFSDENPARMYQRWRT